MIVIYQSYIYLPTDALVTCLFFFFFLLALQPIVGLYFAAL